MKRIAMGVVWFLVFWIGAQFLFGLAIGFEDGFKDGVTGNNASSSYDQGVAEGTAAKDAMAPYAPWILIGSLILAVAGAATGVLPGTRLRKDKDDVS
jgi:hypothetical protein